jgi:Zn finger protein HypA/HybF involved in hydrogenase expression
MAVMDETVALASDILNKVLKEAKKKDASRILEINLEIGDLFKLNPKGIVNSLRLISENTIAGKAEIKLNIVEGVDCVVKKIVVE